MDSTHIWIPDPQLTPGEPVDQMEWAGRYIAENYDRKNVTVINGGDHYNLGSLSSYDRKGGVLMEGQRLTDDIEVGDVGWDLLSEPMHRMKRKPRKVALRGNHEERLYRFMRDDATFDGSWDLDYAEAWGWEIHEYLEPVIIDGIAYAHYFYNEGSGRPYTGEIPGRLAKIGMSFTQGHQQGLRFGLRSTVGGRQYGLVAGSFYIHEEAYRGPQQRDEWRGIVVCHQVEEGAYDPMFVSLDFLCRRFTGLTLADWKRDHS